MTSTTRGSTYRCRHCTTRFTRRSPKGRPPTYCSPACRSAAYRNRSAAYRNRTARAALPVRDPKVARIGEDVVAHSRRLGRLVRATNPRSALDVLRQLAALNREIADFTAVAVQQARDSGAAWGPIGDALEMNADTARTHYSPEKVTRRLNKRRDRMTTASRPAPSGDSSPRESRTPPRQRPARAGAGGEPTTSGGPPRRSTPLSSALSNLHRASGKSLRGLARETEISASFASRVLNGDRHPSWRITEAIALACGIDPASLRPLWEHARAQQPRTPSSHRTPAVDYQALALRPSPATAPGRTPALPAPAADAVTADGLNLLRVLAGLQRHQDSSRPPRLLPALPAAAFG